MFDPFFYRQKNKNTSPKLMSQKEQVDNIDAIFISHAHFDHITDAGWFAEFKDVPIYGSATAKENIIKWAKGEVVPDAAHEFTENGKKNLHVIQAGEVIRLSENVSVEVLPSKHITFDAETIFSRLKSKEFITQMKSVAPLGRKLPKGDVLAYYIHYHDTKIITFGSLYEKNTDLLKKFENCDIFIAPLAGNSAKHIAKKAGIMIDILKPRIVVPTHWDNFFPPISRTENLEPFYEYMKDQHSEITIINLEIDKEIKIENNF